LACAEAMASVAQPHSYYVGERVEAVMGSRGLVVGGSITAENEDGTYAVEFDNGYEYDSLDGSKLAPEVSQEEELQTQMAHLRWRKMQNESKIRSMIVASRQMHEQELLKQMSRDRAREKAEWMKEIIEDELSKPLEVDENFIKKFEDDEKSFRAKSLANKRQHLKSVKKLQKELTLRHELANQKVVDLQRKVREAEMVCRQLELKRADADAELRERFVEEAEMGGMTPGDYKLMDALSRRIKAYYESQEKAEQDVEVLREKLRRAETNARLTDPKLKGDLEPLELDDEGLSASVRLGQSIRSLKDTLKMKGMMKEGNGARRLRPERG